MVSGGSSSGPASFAASFSATTSASKASRRCSGACSKRPVALASSAPAAATSPASEFGHLFINANQKQPRAKDGELQGILHLDVKAK